MFFNGFIIIGELIRDKTIVWPDLLSTVGETTGQTLSRIRLSVPCSHVLFLVTNTLEG